MRNAGGKRRHHAARFVRKSHTRSLAAFASPSAGPLGWVVEGRARVVTRVARVPTFAVAKHGSADACEGRVVLFTTGLSNDGLAVDLLRDSFDGMVIEATGGGYVSLDMAEAMGRAAERVPVILASRAPAGETLASTYRFVGGEIDLQRRGLIRADWLEGVKARVLLSLLLRRGHADRGRVGKEFEGGEARSRCDGTDLLGPAVTWLLAAVAVEACIGRASSAMSL